MKDSEIIKFVEKHGPKEWYYHYDFGCIQVRPELKKVKDNSMRNWKKIRPIIKEKLKKFKNPRVLDIGCNMGLYAYEMEKMGASVMGVDLKTAHAKFFQKYVNENLKDSLFDSKFIKLNVMKKKIPLEEVDIITMFCVIYHLSPKEDFVVENLPKHEYLVLQGNTPRVTSKKRGKQQLAGVNGMNDFLTRHGYRTEIHELKGYTKPIVIGKK